MDSVKELKCFSAAGEGKFDASVQAFYDLECRNKELFFSTSAPNKGIIVKEEERRGSDALLLLKLKRCCRVSDNISFVLTSHYYFKAYLSTSKNKLAKDKTKVISARVTQRFANLMKQYSQEDAYISCSDFARDALLEKLLKEARDRFKNLLDGENAT